MIKKILNLILVFVIIPLNCFEVLANNDKHTLELMEPEAIKTDDGRLIGFGLTWTHVEGVSEYTIIRSDDNYELSKFTVSGDKNRYADTNIDSSLSYTYYVRVEGKGIESNKVETKAGIESITASAADGYDSYVIIRFSANEEFITIDKSIKGMPIKPKKIYYYTDSDNQPEKIHPIISDDKCFVPIRRILEELTEAGASVEWSGALKTATLKFSGRTLQVKILTDTKQELTVSGSTRQKQITNNMVLLYNDRLFLTVDAINILADNILIERNFIWDVFLLEYYFNKK